MTAAVENIEIAVTIVGRDGTDEGGCDGNMAVDGRVDDPKDTFYGPLGYFQAGPTRLSYTKPQLPCIRFWQHVLPDNDETKPRQSQREEQIDGYDKLSFCHP